MDPRMDEALEAALGARQRVLDRLRGLLVRQLHIRREPGELDPDMPLFGAGLGLDSVDAVELMVGLEREFGLRMPDDRASVRSLRTLNSIVDVVLRHEEAARG